MGYSPKPHLLFSYEIIAAFGIVQVNLTLRSLIAIICIAQKSKQKTLKATMVLYSSANIETLQSIQLLI